MTETNDDDNNNLLHLTDAYFNQVVVVNRDYASVVFRSCMPLLPEAETVAFLVSRCIEALALSPNGDNHRVDWLHEVITVCPDDFQIVAEVIQRRFGSPDVVYKLVDLYILRYNGKITEDQKAQICSSIDCSKLSPQVLLEAVRNRIMPLRFVVRAMLIEQLNTRRTILAAATAATENHHHSQLPLLQHHHDVGKPDPPPVTLGSLLQQDTLVRQLAQMKATMAATSSRIVTLEEELSGMKRLLEECHNEKKNERSIMAEAAGGDRKSASFHYGRRSGENNINHGKLIAKSSSFRLINFRGKEKPEGTNWPPSSCTGTPSLTKSISQRLISGLKKAFRGSSSKDVPEKKMVGHGNGGDNKDTIVID